MGERRSGGMMQAGIEGAVDEDTKGPNARLEPGKPSPKPRPRRQGISIEDFELTQDEIRDALIEAIRKKRKAGKK